MSNTEENKNLYLTVTIEEIEKVFEKVENKYKQQFFEMTESRKGKLKNLFNRKQCLADVKGEILSYLDEIIKERNNNE